MAIFNCYVSSPVSLRGLGLFLAHPSCIPGALSAGHSKVAGEPSRGGAQVTSHLGHRSGLQCKVAMEKKTTGTGWGPQDS